MTIHLHQGDLPASFKPATVVAMDCEMMGLDFRRDRLCLVQISNGDGDAHLVQIGVDQTEAPRLQKVLEDPNVIKIFHYARLDLAYLWVHLNIATQNIFDTKIASRLCRTYTDKHGYKDVAKEILGQDVKKDEQSSDWGAAALSDAQKQYAASDVLHLHKIKDALDTMLAREGRVELAAACFAFLPTRAMLDVAGWEDTDIFAH
jgi:ribonuclease D